MIMIVDYDMGNIGSIVNMLKKIGVPAKATRDPKELEQAEKIILPGVGAFDNGMNNLHEFGLYETLNKKACQDKTPTLGICLGMQLMTKKSEEGQAAGLGWFDAETVKFSFQTDDPRLRIPHMGWNTVVPTEPVHPIFASMREDARFYFVHSYHAKCNDQADQIAATHYGYDFCPAFAKDNIIGLQFHPEKSHTFGMQIYKNFAAL